MNQADLSIRLRTLYAGVVADAIQFDMPGVVKLRVLSPRIKPAWSFPEPLVGPAFTCRGERVVAGTDKVEELDLIRLEMLPEMHVRPGYVQVVSTGGFGGVACYGDISALVAQRHGCVGAVVEGYTRDARLIKQHGFPLCCVGTRPEDAYGQWAIRTYGVSVALNGGDDTGPVVVRPDDDWIFADGDGVLVLPGEYLEDICECAEERAADEAAVRAELLEGADPMDVYRRRGRW